MAAAARTTAEEVRDGKAEEEATDVPLLSLFPRLRLFGSSVLASPVPYAHCHPRSRCTALCPHDASQRYIAQLKMKERRTRRGRVQKNRREARRSAQHMRQVSGHLPAQFGWFAAMQALSASRHCVGQRSDEHTAHLVVGRAVLAAAGRARLSGGQGAGCVVRSVAADRRTHRRRLGRRRRLDGGDASGAGASRA